MSDAEHVRTGSALERYLALLEVSEAIAAHRELPALFHELAERLPGIVRFDFLSLVLHEPARNTMRLHILESREPSPTTPGSELPVNQSPGGRVWETQEPLVISNVDEEARFPQAVQLMRRHFLQPAPRDPPRLYKLGPDRCRNQPVEAARAGFPPRQGARSGRNGRAARRLAAGESGRLAPARRAQVG